MLKISKSGLWISCRTLSLKELLLELKTTLYYGQCLVSSDRNSLCHYKLLYIMIRRPVSEISGGCLGGDLGGNIWGIEGISGGHTRESIREHTRTTYRQAHFLTGQLLRLCFDHILSALQAIPHQSCQLQLQAPSCHPPPPPTLRLFPTPGPLSC